MDKQKKHNTTDSSAYLRKFFLLGDFDSMFDLSLSFNVRYI